VTANRRIGVEWEDAWRGGLCVVGLACACCSATEQWENKLVKERVH
jgi:hypothetical protein